MGRLNNELSYEMGGKVEERDVQWRL